MRFRRDFYERQSDGSYVGYSRWMGGNTLSHVKDCDIRPNGKSCGIRYSVEATGHPDTFFSIPAVTKIKGKRITGYLTTDDGIVYFRPHIRFEQYILELGGTK